MASELTAADVSHRLADQLQVLSQLAETLTFRLLDLEERLAGQELQLQPLLEAGGAGSALIAEGTELRLAETEDRLTRLEALLHSGGAADAEPLGEVRHLHSVVLEPPASEGALDHDGELDHDGALLDSEPEHHAFGDADPGDAMGAESSDEAVVAECPYGVDPFLEEHEQSFMDELSA